MDTIFIGDKGRIDIDHRDNGIVYLTVDDSTNRITTETKVLEITPDVIVGLMSSISPSPVIARAIADIARLPPSARKQRN